MTPTKRIPARPAHMSRFSHMSRPYAVARVLSTTGIGAKIIGGSRASAWTSRCWTLDGHGRLELMKFHAPTAQRGDQHAPANTLGIRRVAFAVDDIDAAVAGLQARGAELVGEVERYEDSYRLCYVRGPEGIIVMLAEQIG